jgi:hypothetical protein
MSGDVTPSGWLTGTPITSFKVTSREDIFQTNISLLFTRQEGASHTILDLCLAPAGVCSISKTQLHAKQKAVKNAEAELDEDKNSPLQLVRPSLSQRKRSFLPDDMSVSGLPSPCSQPPSLNFLPSGLRLRAVISLPLAGLPTPPSLASVLPAFLLAFAVSPKPSPKPSGRLQRMRRPSQSRAKNCCCSS